MAQAYRRDDHQRTKVELTGWDFQSPGYILSLAPIGVVRLSIGWSPTSNSADLFTCIESNFRAVKQLGNDILVILGEFCLVSCPRCGAKGIPSAVGGAEHSCTIRGPAFVQFQEFSTGMDSLAAKSGIRVVLPYVTLICDSYRPSYGAEPARQVGRLQFHPQTRRYFSNV